MSVQIDDNPEEERFEALVDGQVAGFAQYRIQGDTITIFHTEIDPAFEGQGIGGELARAALTDVRERRLTLVPLCPFFARYVRRHADEYMDLVAEQIRAKVMAGE